MSRLAEAAAAALATHVALAPLEQLWLDAALRTAASGRRIDPLIGDLRRLTTPGTAWQEVPPWPADALQDRISRLVDCHRLATAYRDTGWLDQLDAAWAAAPDIVGELWPLRARGEIGLARGRRWDRDDMVLLVEESYLVPTAPADGAWLALAGGDPTSAREHLAAYEALLAGSIRNWADAPQEGVRQICAHPDVILHVQARALRALLDIRVPEP